MCSIDFAECTCGIWLGRVISSQKSAHAFAASYARTGSFSLIPVAPLPSGTADLELRSLWGNLSRAWTGASNLTSQRCGVLIYTIVENSGTMRRFAMFCIASYFQRFLLRMPRRISGILLVILSTVSDYLQSVVVMIFWRSHTTYL